MKQKLNWTATSAGWFAAALLLVTLNAQISTLFAQGTAFGYQGRLTDNGSPANGNYDFRFDVRDAATAGNQVGPASTLLAVAVSNGLFAVTLDFGAGVFIGPARWLEIGARTNGGGGNNFTTLSPRQPLLATPYAMYATNAGTASTASGVAAGSVTATGVASGQVVKSLNGLKDNVILGAGANVTLVTNGNGLTVSSTGGASVFSLNGTNAVYTAGNVGLGTASPSPDPRLHIKTTPPGEGVRIQGTASGAANLAWMSFVNSVGTRIGYVGDGSTGDDDVFLTADTADIALVTPAGRVLTATASGNVGIGTESPDHPLTVQSPAGGTTPITWRNPSFDLGALGWDSDGDSGWLGLYRSGNGRVSLRANGSSYFTGGNVGIGTTTPGKTLTVAGDAEIGTGSGDYHHLRVGGGNSDGFLYGSYHALGDGIHLGYNYYADPAGFDQVIHPDGATSRISVQYGSIVLATAPPFQGAPVDRLTVDSVGNVYMVGNCSVATLTIRGGADLAEPFEISLTEKAVPAGAVMVIDEENPGHLKVSTRAYDCHVAGVISGANGVNPGIQMRQQGLLEGGKNVALTGRVYVLADAKNGAINPGDLLTTSYSPGHAMRVTDHSRAQGAILGKAMSELKQGKGMVLLLVSLQ